MSLIVGDDFTQLFRIFERTAFRLEVRDHYNAPRETDSVRKFIAGEPIDMSRAEGWLSMIREATAEGRRFMRVRVVSLPLTDYSRFGLWGAQLTNAAGEDIRYLTRNVAEKVELPSHDYWLFDSRKLARMHFGEDDIFLGAEIVEDPREVVQHNYWRDVAWPESLNSSPQSLATAAPLGQSSHLAAESSGVRVATFVPLLGRKQIERLPERAREVVEYRKSELSLNYIQGCPLDCAYCIRHTYGLWDQRQPRALMSDADAVSELVSHRYFRPHVTLVQVFNRATDPFLPQVRPHTFAVLEDLDERGLTNHILDLRPLADAAERVAVELIARHHLSTVEKSANSGTATPSVAEK